MRVSWLTVFALGAVLWLSACKYGENPPPLPNRIVLGYYTGDPDSLASAEATGTPLNEVSMDLVAMDADGGLHGRLPADLLTSDAAQGKLSYATVSNFGATDFDAAIAHGVLVTHRGAAIQ